jgi:hypothetical protein
VGDREQDGDDLFDEDDEAFLEALDETDRQAVQLLRETLPEIRDLPEPDDLPVFAARIREGPDAWPLEPAVRANGWSSDSLPADDRQLWIETTGALVNPQHDSGLPDEEEALIMTLDHADFAGAVLGAVRAGVGSRAEPRDLVEHAAECPEIEGELDPDDADVIESGFDLVVPVWQAVGAIGTDDRLTELGRWGLPRALAWAWGGDFDAEPEQR